MATILLCALPLSSATNTTLKLAATLRERGHTVVFCGIEDGAQALAPYGYEFIPLFQNWFPAGFVQQWIRSKVGKLSWREHLDLLLEERGKLLHQEKFIDFLIHCGYQEYLSAIAKIQPDLILVDATLHTHWALLAFRSGVRCAYFNPGLPLDEHPIIPPLNSPLPPATDAASQAAVRNAWQSFLTRRWLTNKAMQLAGIADWVQHLRKLARAMGCPPEGFNTRTELMPLLDWPMLILCPQAFDFKEAQSRRAIHYAEACIELARHEADFPWQRLDGGKRLIYCSLGSIASCGPFYQRVIDAVAKRPDWQLVLNLGPTLSPADFHGVPDDAILVNGAPQLALLRQTCVMLNHGGIGTVKECIYFAVPQIVFPIYFDQPGSAARINYHGLGASGSFAQATPDDIHALIDNILRDSSIQSRVQAMSRVFQELEGSTAAAAWIESRLGQS